MKKWFLFFILFLLLFSLPVQAAIGSKGLIINGGEEELIMEKGEKQYLWVRSGFSKLPLFKDVTFFSDNIAIASVGKHSGIVRANGYGSTQIFAVSKDGHAATIQITVRAPKKVASFFWVILAAGSGIALLFLYLKRKSALG